MNTSKPGVRTSEFWGKTIVQASILLAMVTGNDSLEMSPEVAFGIVGFIEAAYAVARGWTKAAESKK